MPHLPPPGMRRPRPVAAPARPEKNPAPGGQAKDCQNQGSYLENCAEDGCEPRRPIILYAL